MLFNVYGDFNFLCQTPLSGFFRRFLFPHTKPSKENDERKGVKNRMQIEPRCDDSMVTNENINCVMKNQSSAFIAHYKFKV